MPQAERQSIERKGRLRVWIQGKLKSDLEVAMVSDAMMPKCVQSHRRQGALLS